MTRKIRKKLRYFQLPPNLAHRKFIDLANYERMKACIDEFQPNTSQANYFEGFWRIRSKTNTKIEISKQFESCMPIADSSKSAHMLLKRNEYLPAWPSLNFLPANPCLF